MTYVMMDAVALDIIILSVLRAGAVHGYELKRRVQRPTLSRLSNNSLYPTLRRFEASGAVTQTTEEHEGRPARKVYAITDVGRRVFADLISSLPFELAGNDEEFLIRLSFFNEIAIANRHAILSTRSAVVEARIAQVRAILEESEDSAARQWRNLAMSQLVARLEQERQWIAELATKAEEDE